MKLNSIIIENFRSIERIELPITQVAGSAAHCLIGENEAGKSSILRAVSLIDSSDVAGIWPLNFYDDKQPIVVRLQYSLDVKDIEQLTADLGNIGLDNSLISAIKIKSVRVGIKIEPTESSEKSIFEDIDFEQSVIPSHALIDGTIVQREGHVKISRRSI